MLQISISLFLIYRFLFAHASRSAIISNFDKEVIITSATFMLVNVITGVIFDKYEVQLRNYMSNLFKKNKNKNVQVSNSSIHYSTLKEPIQNVVNTDTNIEPDIKSNIEPDIKSNIELDIKSQKHSIYNYLPNEQKI
jgi:ribosomal protein L31